MTTFSLLLVRAAGAGRRFCARCALAITAAAVLGLATGAAVANKKPGGTKLPYSYFYVGNPGAISDATQKIVDDPLKRPSFLLMGGGPDVDEGFRLMIRKAGATATTGGRFLVIRATGTDAYNAYIYDSGGSAWTSYVGGKDLHLTSVETLLIPNRTAAEHPDVLNIIRRADMLFIAGGDQADYINFWKGSGVELAIKSLMARNVPIGGTSAGLAVLGQIDFAALNGTVQSPQALSDPFNRYMTLDPNPLSLTSGFIAPPALRFAVLDAHLDERDRLGRLMSFVARMIGPNGETGGCSGGILPSGASGARGIGLGVETALWVEVDAHGKASGKRLTNDATNSRYPPDAAPTPSAVYFVRPQAAPSVCAAKKPLTMPRLEVYRLADSTISFDLSTWFLNYNDQYSNAAATYNADINAGIINWGAKPFVY